MSSALTSCAKGRAALAVLAALVASILLAGCSATGGAQADNVAAVFGDHVILEDEITDYTQDYRASRSLEDDEAWRNHLITNGMTVKTWREGAIREKADRLLIEDKAAEMGIVADGQAVDEHIAQDKAGAGIDPGDESAWADFLAETGQTPEGLREAYEYTSIQQQVYLNEIEFTGEMLSEMCDDYIKANLADQIVHRYTALSFQLDDREAAQASLDRLQGKTGEELADAFEQELSLRLQIGGFGADENISGGDLGWDFMYDEYAIDPELKLRKALLEPETLFGEVLEGSDALRVVMCSEEARFVDVDYDSIQSESLRGVVSQLARTSNWTALCLDYMSRLEEEADIKVAPLPDGLPYYVEIEGSGD